MISAVEVIIEEFSLPEEIAAVTLIGLMLLQLFIGTNCFFQHLDLQHQKYFSTRLAQ
jgi:hypothetical protein